MEHNMTIVAMQLKDAAAMLDRLANDRSVIEEFMERIATRDQLEFALGQVEHERDKLLDPVERGANDAARTLVGVVRKYIEEQSGDGLDVDDELMLQVCGALTLHIEARKDKAAEDIRALFDLCFEKTLHLLDEEDREILRAKGLLE
jgi:hypothetical protein